MSWFVLVIWPIIAFAHAKPASSRIVGGNDAKIENHPYQVALISNKKFICGGSLISSSTVLTAAHCVHNKPSRLFIRVGSNNAQSDGQTYNVQNLCIHPLWNKPTGDYDVAVLQLEHPVSLSKRVGIIQLQPEGIAVPDEAEAVAIGWKTSDTEKVENVLQSVAMEKVLEQKCAKMIYPHRITSRMICYLKFGVKAGPCQGDSGGPLVVNGKQVGITSWIKSDCGHLAYPTMFVHIEEKSINKHIQQCVKTYS